MFKRPPAIAGFARQFEVALRQKERLGRDVHPDKVCELLFCNQSPQQRARAASEVEQRSRPTSEQERRDCVQPLLVQRGAQVFRPKSQFKSLDSKVKKWLRRSATFALAKLNHLPHWTAVVTFF